MMPSTTTLDTYADQIARLMMGERSALAARWLVRLRELLDVAANDVFPSDQLLDHIPALIGDIAAYVRAPLDEEIAANSAVIDKARELGVLRYGQKATVHQLLREYEILGELLETFVADATERLALAPSPGECFAVQRRLMRSARTLMRTTVDTFLAEYTQAIEDRNQRLDKFNRMASHEMRTPIGTLTFAAALLHAPDIQSDRERLTQVAAVIENSATRLTWVINNLHRVARLDATDTPTHQRVSVSAIAEEVARQLEEMAVARGVAIRIDPSLPTILCDPARLELILLNLVSNALKYRDPAKTEPFVEITHEPVLMPACDSALPRWRLLVRDNGIGIPADQRSGIFKRFVRVHAHLDEVLGVTGTGLGLSIVADCVEALGGTIACESQPGEGTTFVMQLPALVASTV